MAELVPGAKLSFVDASAEAQQRHAIGEEVEIWRPLIYLMFFIIAAEFLLSSSGLGDLIIRNTERFQTANVLACVLTIMLLATALIGIGRALENYFARWRAGA